jgi:hypothetical protein
MPPGDFWVVLMLLLSQALTALFSDFAALLPEEPQAAPHLFSTNGPVAMLLLKAIWLFS